MYNAYAVNTQEFIFYTKLGLASTAPILFLCLLCLVDGLCHGEEGAVGEDGQHDQVVKVLVHRHVDGDTTQLKQGLSLSTKCTNIYLHRLRVRAINKKLTRGSLARQFEKNKGRQNNSLADPEPV